MRQYESLFQKEGRIMISLICAFAVLLLGYLVYGRLIEKTIEPDDRTTPAYTKEDGVDFVPMKTWKAFLVQLLNIAGTGPIFGALMGACFGPVVFLWIVFGAILGGAVHDFMIGMISERHDGASIAELSGIYLGNVVKWIMRIFSILLLLLTGTVFVTSPAGLLSMLTPDFMDKQVWIVIILAFPVLGVILYAMFRLFTPTKAMGKRQAAIDEELFLHLKPDAAVAERLQAEDQRAFNQCNYLRRYGYFPVYDDTRTSYYADTTDALAAMKEELAKAKSFIFMEYLAIEDAEAFGELLEIMAQKAKEGVEVRVFYDDFGSFTFINNKDFIKRMNGFGIQCRVFNPAAPWLKVEMNNRDHRKMTIIDGHVGFTGGYNLANEYFNYTSPYDRIRNMDMCSLMGTAPWITSIPGKTFI